MDAAMASEVDPAVAAAAFIRMDLNGDGIIDIDELSIVLQSLDSAAWSDERLAQLFAIIDANEDGEIQRDEFGQWIWHIEANGEHDEDGREIRLMHRDFVEAVDEIVGNVQPKAAFQGVGPKKAPAQQVSELDHLEAAMGNDGMCAGVDLKVAIRGVEVKRVGTPGLSELDASVQGCGPKFAVAQKLSELDHLDAVMCALDAGDFAAALQFMGSQELEDNSYGPPADSFEDEELRHLRGPRPALPMQSPALGGVPALRAADEGAECNFQRRESVGQCPRGHPWVLRPCKAFEYCSNCTYRATMWCGGSQRTPYLCCPICDLELCGDCSGLGLAEAPAIPTPEHVAWTALLQLVEDARGDPKALLPSAKVEFPSQDGMVAVELCAFVVGPVVRQSIDQGYLAVCGAAATAAALNACTEQLSTKRQRLELTWKTVLFDHFRDKLKLKVRDREGDPATWKVGKPHIRQVIESFPGMRTRDLITETEAAPKNRAAAWKSLVTELRKPNTAVYYHTRCRWWGHYTLVYGAVGPTPNGKGDNGEIPAPIAYDRERCAILTNQLFQEPRQRLSFEKACDPIVKTKGFFRMFVVEYRPR